MQQAQAAHKALFGEDIEEEANSHFQRIYMSEIEIGEVVDMLSRLRLNNNNNSITINNNNNNNNNNNLCLSTNLNKQLKKELSYASQRIYASKLIWRCCAG